MRPHDHDTFQPWAARTEPLMFCDLSIWTDSAKNRINWGCFERMATWYQNIKSNWPDNQWL